MTILKFSKKAPPENPATSVEPKPKVQTESPTVGPDEPPVVDDLSIAISELQSGHRREESSRIIFDRYHGTLVRFFAKRGFKPEACQDLAQDVFLKVFNHIQNFRHDGPFEGWLFQIAANIYRNRIRDESAIKRDARESSLDTLLEELLQIPDGDNPLGAQAPTSPLEGYLHKESLRVLAAALEELPEQMRRCLMLRIYQQLKYRQIATVMRISIETVKAHLYQARRRLKDRLRDYFEMADVESRMGEGE